MRHDVRRWRTRTLLFTSSTRPADDLIEPTRRRLRSHGVVANDVRSNDELINSGRRAIGVVFMVPAATMANAADFALDVVQHAFRDADVTFEELYELTIWPAR